MTLDGCEEADMQKFAFNAKNSIKKKVGHSMTIIKAIEREFRQIICFEPSIMQSIEKFTISYEHAAVLYDAKPAGDVFLYYSVMKGESKIYYKATQKNRKFKDIFFSFI